MKSFILLILILLVQPLFGQKIDSYIKDIGEALVPNGTLYAPTCHNAVIEIKGSWANFAIPDGVDKKSGEFTWSVLRSDVIRIFFDFSDLDEDKVQNHPVFSLGYIQKHKKGTPYVADTPTVMFFTKGLNNKMTVNTIDLDLVEKLHGRNSVTEKQMGLSIDERKFAFIQFVDQQHADIFQKAIQKTIILCKGQ